MFRSDVVGSLLRPPYLKEARDRYASGKISDAEFKQVEDRAVDEAVALQTRAGIEVLTDGEMRRYAFYGHLIDAVEGFDKFGGWAIPFRDEKGEELVLPRPVVVSRLRRKRPLCAEEFTYLRARTDRPAKTTMISAQQAAAYYDGKKSSGAYPTIEPYLTDLVDILRDEVQELTRLGCSYIQIDSPQYTALLDPQLREGYRQRGNDPDRLLDLSIEMGNAVIGDHPGVYDKFLATFVDRVSKLKVGDPHDPQTDLGPLINRRQSEGFAKQVQKGIDEGAKPALRGKVEGNVASPTVFADVRPDMWIARNEMFGPAVCIMPFDTAEEAIRIANDSAYGLSGAIHTRDAEHGAELAKQIESGMVHVNDGTINDDPHIAFGGEKASGVGRLNGKWALEEFTTLKWVSVQHKPRHYPFEVAAAS